MTIPTKFSSYDTFNDQQGTTRFTKHIDGSVILPSEMYSPLGRPISPHMAIINVMDHGAKGDGIQDDQPAVQSAFDAVPVGGGVVVFPYGRYLLGTKVNVNVAGTVVMGGGATLLGSQDQNIFWVAAPDVTLLHLILDGMNVVKKGLDILDGSDNVIVRHCTVKNVLRNDGSTADGILVGNCKNVDISFNDVLNIGTVDDEPARGIRFSSNDAGAFVSGKCIGNNIHHVYPVADGDGIVVQSYPVRNKLLIALNTLTECAKRAIKVQVAGCTVVNNICTMTAVDDGPGPRCAITTQADHTVVSHNQCDMTNAVDAALIIFGDHITAIGNVCTMSASGANCDAITVNGAIQFFTFANNIITGGCRRAMMFEGGASHGTISQNVIDNTTSNAIQFDGTTTEDLSLLGNVITNIGSQVVAYTGGGTPARIIVDTVYDGSGSDQLYRNGGLPIRQANPLSHIYGSGSPEGVVSGDPGHRYTDSTGGIQYTKTSGTGTNTGWSALATV